MRLGSLPMDLFRGRRRRLFLLLVLALVRTQRRHLGECFTYKQSEWK